MHTPDKVLEVVMVLESKYGAKGTTMIEHVLDYLNEVNSILLHSLLISKDCILKIPCTHNYILKVIDEKSETYEIQRLNIYSLLGTEGSLQAQNVS